MAHVDATSGAAVDDRRDADRPDDERRDRRDDERHEHPDPHDASLAGYVTTEVVGSPPIFARGRELRIAELYVRPVHRRRGVGTALLDRVRTWGREQGCETAAVSVTTDNDAARACYEAAGFRDVRRTYRTRLE